MNTNNILHFDRVQLVRFIEVALYAGLAAVLIGWIFSHQGFVTFREASLVMLGAVFGLMASCGGAPLSSLLLCGNTGRQASGEVFQHVSGDVLSFGQRRSHGEASQINDTSRRAA